MTNEQNFIPAADPKTLAHRCAATLNANGELLGAILSDFPKTKLDAIDRLLAGGGSVGLETLVDRNAANVIRVIGIEREGLRLVLATVSLGGSNPAVH